MSARSEAARLPPGKAAPIPPSKFILPLAVRRARREYIDVKEAHGLCAVLSCSRPRAEGYSYCAKCRARYTAAQARLDARKKAARSTQPSSHATEGTKR